MGAHLSAETEGASRETHVLRSISLFSILAAEYMGTRIPRGGSRGRAGRRTRRQCGEPLRPTLKQQAENWQRRGIMVSSRIKSNTDYANCARCRTVNSGRTSRSGVPPAAGGVHQSSMWFCIAMIAHRHPGALLRFDSCPIGTPRAVRSRCAGTPAGPLPELVFALSRASKEHTG